VCRKAKIFRLYGTRGQTMAAADIVRNNAECQE
jgi:hypothetical protein